MIDPRHLAFDIDGVIAHTMALFLDILNTVYGINHIVYDDITKYQLDACLDVDPAIIDATTERIITGNYPCRLSPIDGAVPVLERLHAFGPIRLVTARPYPGPMREWFDALLPPETFRVDIAATGSFEAKVQVLKENGVTCFVEDRLETCFLVQESGITPILFIQPWNRRPHPFREVASWSELEACIRWQDEERP
jgi:5'(3')-deoxyribonucleotidase